MKNNEIGKIGISNEHFSKNITNNYFNPVIFTEFIPIVSTKRVSYNSKWLKLIFSFPFKFLQQKTVNSQNKINILKSIKHIFNLYVDIDFPSLINKKPLLYSENLKFDNISTKQEKSILYNFEDIRSGNYLSFADKWNAFNDLFIYYRAHEHLKGKVLTTKNDNLVFKDNFNFSSHKKSIAFLENQKFDNLNIKWEKSVQNDFKGFKVGMDNFLSFKYEFTAFNQLLTRLNHEIDFIFSKSQQSFFQILEEQTKIIDHVSKRLMNDLKEIKLKYWPSISLLNPLVYDGSLMFGNSQGQYISSLENQKLLFYGNLMGSDRKNSGLTVLKSNLSIITEQSNFVHNISSTIYKRVKSNVSSFKPILVEKQDYFGFMGNINGIDVQKEAHRAFRYNKYNFDKRMYEDNLELYKLHKYQLYPEIGHLKPTKAEVFKEKVVEKEIISKTQDKTPKIPEIDTNRLADTVYQLIERKIRIERERRGISLL